MAIAHKPTSMFDITRPYADPRRLYEDGPRPPEHESDVKPVSAKAKITITTSKGNLFEIEGRFHETSLFEAVNGLVANHQVKA